VPWLITALCLTLALAALVSVFRNADLSGSGRALWAVIVLVLPVLGPAVYFGVRRDW
jgi:phospholipase D-like protein